MKEIRYLCYNKLNDEVILSTNIKSIIEFMKISRSTFKRLNKGSIAYYKDYVLHNDVQISKCNYRVRKR